MEQTAESPATFTRPTRRVKVIFLPHADRQDLFSPWGEDVVAALGDRHDLTFYDLSKPPAEQLESAEVVIDHGGHSRTHEMADACRALKLWQILGTGFDAFDVAYWNGKGIPVSNCPGSFSATALGEAALMLLLMLARRYPLAAQRLRAGLLYDPIGLELEGRSLALVGFGASARALAIRARAFGMRISTIDVREVGVDELAEYGLEWVGRPDDLDEMLGRCDFVSLHLHLNSETRNIIDERRIALMKPGALLINVARGALIDEEAMERALVDGHLGGAGLDVFSDEPPDLRRPLFNLPNVVVTPHVAGVTDGTSRNRARCVAENVDRVGAGLDPLYRIV